MHSRDRLVLAEQLIVHFHLSVAERQRLPAGRMPLSAILAVVRESFVRDPFFPRNLRPEALGDGAVLERLTAHRYRVHERYEVGILRFSDVHARTYRLLRWAVIRYLRHYGPLRIDGVPIHRWS